MRKLFHSFTYAFKGLKIVWQEEINFRIEVVVGLIVLLLIFYFHFSLLESSLMIFAITLVLSSEIVNTAIEDTCNKINPNSDSIIAKIKDVSGAFVLVSVFGAIIVGILIFYNHFFLI